MDLRLVLPKIVVVLMLGGGLLGGGGKVFQPSDPPNVIQGFGGNRIASGVTGATISGGGTLAFPNRISGDYGVIGGGKQNVAGEFSTVGGGADNSASGFRATIGGGANNLANRNSAVVAGGYQNRASQLFATVGGGIVNVANGADSTVAGGSGNRVDGLQSTIGGGARNQVSGAYSTVGGGVFNGVTSGYSTVAGGTHNQATGIGAAIGGGAGNQAAGLQSTLGGGLSNQVTDNYSVVAGGRQNAAGNGDKDEQDAAYASVGGGYGNQAAGLYSSVPGGYANIASGDYSVAIGNQAQISAEDPGAMLFSDASDFPFTSTAPNEFAVRATGGVRFVTALTGNGAPLAGVQLAKGSGTWETLSDRNAKADIHLSTWQYKGEPGKVKHMGPMAQDFYAAFGLGPDQHYIGSVDADGVALAAIQGLNQMIRQKDARISMLQSESADQEEQIQNLEARMTRLERNTSQGNLWPAALLAAVAGFLLGFAMERYLRITGSRRSDP